ncbi:hypothetical protein KCU81_g7185, partial [Aureobasidium melanogenum]
MVMEQYPQDDLDQGYSIDQNKMLSAKVSPGNLEQADTSVDSGQPQTAAPFQQFHPSILLSQLRESEPQDSPGHTRGVDQVNIAPADPSPEQRLRNGSQISLQQDALSPTTAFPQDGSVLLGIPNRPVSFLAPLVARPSLADTDLALANMTELQSSPSRVLPIGELIISNAKRTYTIWIHKQPKPDIISIQITMTNVNTTTSFTSYSGVSRCSPSEIPQDFSSLLRAQGIELMSLNVVEGSFVAAVDTNKGREVLRKGALHVVR